MQSLSFFMFPFFLTIIFASERIEPIPNITNTGLDNEIFSNSINTDESPRPKINFSNVQISDNNTYSTIETSNELINNSNIDEETQQISELNNVEINKTAEVTKDINNKYKEETNISNNASVNNISSIEISDTSTSSIQTPSIESKTVQTTIPPTKIQTIPPTISPMPTASPTPYPSPSASQPPPPSSTSPPCRGKNQERVGGVCVCAAGFETDGSSTDCYKCPRCGANSLCARPGRCVCIDGFIQSGKECVRAPPVLRAISPSECGRSERCRVNVSVDTIDPAENAFCRFGNVIVNADAVTSSAISCLAPLLEASVVDVHVSFDARHWSESAGQLTLLSKRPAPFSWLWPTLGFALAFVVVFALVFILRSSDRRHSDFHHLYKAHGHTQNVRHRTVL